MKKVFLFLVWFIVFTFSFVWLGGFMHGLSNSLFFNNADVAISISIILAFFISAVGVSKKLLPGTSV